MSELKDPAVLFFPSEFLLETMLMSNEAIGKYMKVLCAQFAHGHLTLDTIRSFCGDDTDIILKQLQTDKNGLYYHERLEFEIKKRNTFCESRSQNASKKKNKEKTDSNAKAESDGEKEQSEAEKKEKAEETEEKKAYGKEKNVLLTDGEYKELKQVFKNGLDDRIERVSQYIKSKNVKSDSHFLILKRWIMYEKEPRVDGQSYDDIEDLVTSDLQLSKENGGRFIRKMKTEAS